MEIRYTDHAVRRMQERKISPDEVELIIRKPDGVIEQSNDKSIFFKKIKRRNDNMIAAVTVLRAKTLYEVITVMINFEVNK